MKKNYRDKAIVKKRMYMTLCTIWILLFILTLRLSYIMIFKGSEYSKLAVEQWTSEVKIAAKRGKILDRNGKELAVSANVYRVDFDLNAIRDFNKEHGTTNEELAVKISQALSITKEEVLKKLEFRLPSGALAGSAILVRRIEKENADKVKELQITGVIVSPDTKRYYTNDNFLSHVLGTTNSDGVGLNGVELKYDKILSGTPGLRITEIGGEKNDFPYTVSKFTAPVDGKDVILTIDEQIQYFAEKTAEIGLRSNNADAVSVVVMNPNNGEILAMANKPDFNPNTPYEGAENFPGNTSSDKLQKMWRNRVVSDSFEPGSIFKIITASAALETGVAGGDETYSCSGGLHIADRYIKCWKRGGHGSLTFDEILQNSCNVGFMQVGAKVGKEKLNEYIKKFGLGKKSGVDLPGEASGIIKKTESITDMDLATISFGQTNTVNSIQFMAAVNTVANGGTLIQPHVMKEVSYIDENGNKGTQSSFDPKLAKNVLNKTTVDRMRAALEKTVHFGSPKATYMEGYGIAGKTGTAQKVNPETGGYGNGYVASFVGFAPYDNPQISVMISVDNPKNGEYYGGRVAAPLANILFTDILNYINLSGFNLSGVPKPEEIVVPEIRNLSVQEAKKALNDAKFEVEVEGDGSKVKDMLPKPGYKVNLGSKVTIYTDESTNYNKNVIVPDFTGISKQEAEEILSQIGLKGEFQGQGNIIKQNITPYDVVDSGSTIKLTLGNKR